MTTQSDKRWDRLVEYAALARAKPTFDVEERDWKLAMADRLQEALSAARDGGEWLPSLRTAYREGGLAGLPSWQAQRDWYTAWSAADPESSRRALAAFLDSAPTAEERISAFAQALEEAAAKGSVTVQGNAALRLGSVLNFAVEPLRLPMMRPGQFAKLERILGCPPPGTMPAAELYAEHLAFARRVGSRMEQSGLPVRDMIDVESLIHIAAIESDFWAGDRLYAIGVAARSEQRNPPREERAETRPYLSVCAIYRNEAPYLREWIEFHRLVGVEHFFLYDNMSTDNHREELAPYLEDGTVTLQSWEPVPPHQPDVVHHFLDAYRGASRWIAFLDLDEFLFSPTGRTLPDLLVDYEPWPGIGVNWAIFGRSGHATKPPGLVIENYLMRVHTPRNKFTKCIVDPSRVDHCHLVHHFVYDSLLAVDENHYPIQGAHTKSVSFSKLRINHYVTKSDEEARSKLGRPEEWKHSLTWRSTSLEDKFPQERDETITTYLPALRAAMATGG